jgi:hypothetical protein
MGFVESMALLKFMPIARGVSDDDIYLDVVYTSEMLFIDEVHVWIDATTSHSIPAMLTISDSSSAKCQ